MIDLTEHCRHLRFRLKNGLTVLVLENRRLPLLSIVGFVRAGSDQNPPNQPGLSSLTCRLLDEGTRHYSALQLAARVESTGGGLITLSQREATGVFLNLSADKLEMGVEILAELLRYPLFPVARFDLEKQKTLAHLSALADDPQAVAARLLNESVYEGGPFQYPVLGSRESIERMQLAEVRSFHRRKFAPRASFVVVVGAVELAQVEDSVSRHFEEWSNRDYCHSQVPIPGRQNRPVQRRVFMDKEQVYVALGHLGVRRKNPDFYALQVTDIILGGGPGFTSRIPRKLRDEQGLAYSVSSDISSSSGIYPGCFVASLSTSPENVEHAVRTLVDEVEALQEKGVGTEELRAARDFLTGSFVFDFQSNSDLARFLILTELFDLGMDYPQRYIEIIRSVTAEDIRRVARKYLDTVNYTSVRVGPIPC